MNLRARAEGTLQPPRKQAADGGGACREFQGDPAMTLPLLPLPGARTSGTPPSSVPGSALCTGVPLPGSRVARTFVWVSPERRGWKGQPSHPDFLGQTTLKVPRTVWRPPPQGPCAGHRVCTSWENVKNYIICGTQETEPAASLIFYLP